MGLIRNIRKGFMFLRGGPGIAPEDAALVTRYLNDAERAAFFGMDPPDQAHSLRVTRHCEEALKAYPELDERSMMKAALLHDIGKTGAGLGLTFRTFWVLSHKFAPELLDRIARRGERARPRSLRRKLYVQVAHAAIGAAMLAQTGTEEEVRDLVYCTGEYCEPNDPLEKWLLLSADADRVLTPEREAQWRGETKPSPERERGA